MPENNVIENLRNKLPWSDFFSIMEREGFLKYSSLSGFTRSRTENFTNSFISGFIMLIGNKIQGGAIRDPSHLHLIPRVIFRPKTEIQLQKIIINSQKFKIPITFASGKTGLSGGYVNYAIIVDLEDLHSYSKPFIIDVKNEIVKVEQGVLISDLIKWVQYISNKRLIFPIQPTSALKLPVRVGGLISSNASGITSGKLGAAEDWIN